MRARQRKLVVPLSALNVLSVAVLGGSLTHILPIDEGRQWALVVALVTAALAAGSYWWRRNIMKTMARSDAVRHLVTTDNACRVLVIGLSDIHFRNQESDVKADIAKAKAGHAFFDAETVALPVAAFRERGAGLDDDPGGFPAPVAWQQAIRTLWAHRDKRPVVHVIASKESSGQIDLFRDYATALFARSGNWSPEIRQATYRGTATGMAVDYETYNDVFDAVSDVLARLIEDDNHRPSEICVDATAGQKTFSIAVAVATLNSHTHVGYTTNQGIPKFYEVRTMADAPA